MDRRMFSVICRSRCLQADAAEEQRTEDRGGHPYQSSLHSNFPSEVVRRARADAIGCCSGHANFTRKVLVLRRPPPFVATTA
jgi:hypothetical protein